MGVHFIPSHEAQLVQYGLNFKTRIAAAPALFSLTPAQATAFGTLYDTFVSAFNIAQSEATNSKSAIITKNTAKRAMIAYLRTLAGIVQKAPTTTDTMRSDLGLTVPKVPSPPAKPGTPGDFKASLTALGALDLSWKCTNPTGGTIYQVFRQIGTADATYLGGSGAKKFVDASLPAGTAKATYQVQAVRSTAGGLWATFVVNIGVPGAGGGMSVTAVDAPAVKIAA